MNDADWRDWAWEHKQVRVPVTATLRKYGLTVRTYLNILARQGWCCPICTRSPPEVTYSTDHEHVRGWKKMPPDRRIFYVRGITCVHCNLGFLPIGFSSTKAHAAGDYLKSYEDRVKASVQNPGE